MWTRFMDMHSGGGTKEEPYEYIYIEAPEDEAKVIFYNRFDHNPERVTCTCCGDDYGIDSKEELDQLTGYERGCDFGYVLEDGREVGEDYWHEVPFDDRRSLNKLGRYFERLSKKAFGRKYVSLDDYLKREDVLVIRASEILNTERKGDVPVQGYVWA